MKKVTKEDLAQVSDAIFLDVRDAASFVGGYYAESIYLADDEYFTQLLSLFVAKDSPLVIIAEASVSEKIERTLEEQGYDVLGYLPYEGSATVLPDHDTEMIIDVDSYELAIDLPNDDNLLAVDVRSLAEFDQEHLDNARHLPLIDLTDVALVASLPEEANIYVYCSNGNRSATACSLLRIQGLYNIRWIAGGMQNMKQQAGLPITKSKAKLN